MEAKLQRTYPPHYRTAAGDWLASFPNRRFWAINPVTGRPLTPLSFDAPLRTRRTGIAVAISACFSASARLYIAGAK